MRYKEFNKNRILEQCIPLFWDKGFGAVAIREIVEKTGVNRFSLYEEFENKEGIFFASLDLYYERYGSKKLDILDSTQPLLQSLKTFYMDFLTENNAHPPGCYILHSATELADTYKKVKETLDQYLGKIEEKFRALLNRHINTKELSDFYARQLVGLFCTSISFCLIHSHEKRLHYIDNGINLILDKGSYATTS